MGYQAIIGLEIHIQSKTQSKMFCSCPASYFGKEPNTQVCPTCLGLPGALPTINEKAIDYCVMLGLALNCTINKETKFDRKNYFYPDLPKGYQISQYDLPIAENGWVEIEVGDDVKRIRITRVHQEEDTGKSMHEKDIDSGEEYTLLDFNKSGVPLVEVVTEPDFTNVEEVLLFAKRLRQIVRYLGISDADMEKGQMRFELNISLRKPGEKKLPDYKVEVKNIGAINILEKVIKYEIERQREILESGKKVKQETRGLDDEKGKTFSQRGKEEAQDYRYFPEPDLPPLRFDKKYLEEMRKSLPELPDEKRKRFEEEYGLPSYDAGVLTASVRKADYYEEAVRAMGNEQWAVGKPKAQSSKLKAICKDVANWMIGDLAALQKKKKVPFSKLKVKPEYIAEIVTLVKSNKISGTVAKQVLEACFDSGRSPMKIVKDQGLEQVSDEGELAGIVNTVIQNNLKAVEDFKQGNENTIGFLIGQVMKETKGRANPKVIDRMLREKLN